MKMGQLLPNQVLKKDYLLGEKLQYLLPKLQKVRVIKGVMVML